MNITFSILIGFGVWLTGLSLMFYVMSKDMRELLRFKSNAMQTDNDVLDMMVKQDEKLEKLKKQVQLLSVRGKLNEITTEEKKKRSK
jgi:hypothetical protein